MPLQQTSGNDTSDAYGGGAAAVANYIENVFSTYLYTGTGAAQTITNNIDLSTKGGLVWIKSRSAVQNNNLFDTTQGATKLLHSNTGDSTLTGVNTLTAFNTTGFTLGTGNSAGLQVNTSAETYVSWTFRKQPKFFDIVTWTGSGTPGRTISHSLGSVPGCIMVKCTSTTYSWFVYHKDAINGGGTSALNLSTTAATTNEGNAGIQNLTTTTFQLGGSGAYSTRLDDPSATYIAYIFASNAGGFGLTGTNNVITCGSYTGNGSATGPSITLNYEPQWVLVKNSTNINSWVLEDVMRGMSQTSSNILAPNQSSTESALNPGIIPNATGFSLGTTNGVLNTSGDTYIYIAIRRGPMATPTVGTSVFKPSTRTGTGATGSSTALGAVTDLVFTKNRTSTTQTWTWTDRLRGATQELYSVNTSAETTKINDVTGFDINTGFNFGTGASGTINTSASTYIDYLFARAPSVFDIVCYTGTGAAATINHNLGVSPELVIIKNRSSGGTGNWNVYAAPLGFSSLQGLAFNDALPVGTYNPPVSAVSSTTFTNTSTSYVTGITYVAYLFASLTGVIKIGTYTGTGATQTINCGFTGGARFVMIKSVGSGNNGEWWELDTARGMVSGTDPRISTNNNTAENNTANWVLTTSVGFQVVTSDAEFNLNGNTYLYMAIA